MQTTITVMVQLGCSLLTVPLKWAEDSSVSCTGRPLTSSSGFYGILLVQRMGGGQSAACRYVQLQPHSSSHHSPLSQNFPGAPMMSTRVPAILTILFLSLRDDVCCVNDDDHLVIIHSTMRAIFLPNFVLFYEFS